MNVLSHMSGLIGPFYATHTLCHFLLIYPALATPPGCERLVCSARPETALAGPLSASTLTSIGVPQEHHNAAMLYMAQLWPAEVAPIWALHRVPELEVPAKASLLGCVLIFRVEMIPCEITRGLRYNFGKNPYAILQTGAGSPSAVAPAPSGARVMVKAPSGKVLSVQSVDLRVSERTARQSGERMNGAFVHWALPILRFANQMWVASQQDTLSGGEMTRVLDTAGAALQHVSRIGWLARQMRFEAVGVQRLATACLEAARCSGEGRLAPDVLEEMVRIESQATTFATTLVETAVKYLKALITRFSLEDAAVEGVLKCSPRKHSARTIRGTKGCSSCGASVR